jgi:hypothetical protein
VNNVTPARRVSGSPWLTRLGRLSLVAGTLVLAMGAPATVQAQGAGVDMSTSPPTPDPRVGLRPGRDDAGMASWNMTLVANRPSPPEFAGATNSDLAFLRDYVIQGNYNGFMVWDVSTPLNPRLTKGFVCPASQSDVSVYRNLLFVSSESTSGRLDCGSEPPQEAVSHERLRGVRIFEISDISNPVYLTNVQTCRGSHTHTVVTDPNDDAHVYVYVSGSANVRPAEELPGCSDLSPDEDPTSALFRIEVIQVPLAAPEQARIVTSPRIFRGLDPAPRRAEATRPGADPRRNAGPNQCHDITTYPALGIAGGACQGYGILLDIRRPAEPQRLYAAADTNFAAWHSVTFSNDGSKVVFTDEWGGGSAPRCRATDSMVWGANAIFEIVGDRLDFRSYYKMPAAQTETENCVAHNGSLVPIPGRDIKVQGWYQGGVSMFEWTDPSNPVEIAYFDRGPLVADTLRSAGSWSTYWYNGYVYTSEIARGIDVLELQPSGFISQNELDAAKTVRLEYFNAQEQQLFVWPTTFVLAGAYLDQLERGNGLDSARIGTVRSELARAQGLTGQGRRDALTQLASQLEGDASRSPAAAKVRTLAGVVRDLATAGG